MKQIYVTTGFLATFLLASLTGLAQKKYETPKVNPSEPKVVA